MRIHGATDPAPLSTLFFVDRRSEGPASPHFAPTADPQLLLAATFNFVLATPKRLQRLLEVCALAAKLRVELITSGSDTSVPELADAIKQAAELADMTRWLAGIFDPSGRASSARLLRSLEPHGAALAEAGPLRVAHSGHEIGGRTPLCLLDGYLDNATQLSDALGSHFGAPHEELLAAAWLQWGPAAPGPDARRLCPPDMG